MRARQETNKAKLDQLYPERIQSYKPVGFVERTENTYDKLGKSIEIKNLSGNDQILKYRRNRDLRKEKAQLTLEF